MAQQYPSYYTQCSNCSYWSGPRDYDWRIQRVIVPGPMSVGTCLCQGCGSFQLRTQANGGSSCRCFRQWM